MELGAIIEAIYKSEINCSVTTFWDAGITVRLGDDMNGFVAEANCKTTLEAAKFLDHAAREHFPTSVYALGQKERDRRYQAQKDRHKNN